MTGLEKILAEIEGEAAAEAEQTLATAQREADRLLAAARADAGAKAAQTAAAADAEVAEIERSRDSALVLQRRQRMLAQKQQLLAETLELAHQRLLGLDDGAYFALLVKLAAKNAQPGEGALLLNERDANRAPKDFAKQLAAALPKGSTLSVGTERRPIDGGFVLKYGDVEENCSFAAVFDARADEFSDLVRGTLFA